MGAGLGRARKVSPQGNARTRGRAQRAALVPALGNLLEICPPRCWGELLLGCLTGDATPKLTEMPVEPSGCGWSLQPKPESKFLPSCSVSPRPSPDRGRPTGRGRERDQVHFTGGQKGALEAERQQVHTWHKPHSEACWMELLGGVWWGLKCSKINHVLIIIEAG